MMDSILYLVGMFFFIERRKTLTPIFSVFHLSHIFHTLPTEFKLLIDFWRSRLDFLPLAHSVCSLISHQSADSEVRWLIFCHHLDIYLLDVFANLLFARVWRCVCIRVHTWWRGRHKNSFWEHICDYQTSCEIYQ